MLAHLPEKLSRVYFTFDYHLLVIDFDEDSFVSSFAKDNQHRKHGKVQTFRLGEGDLGLRVYNKCDEIQESSANTWLITSGTFALNHNRFQPLFFNEL